MQPVVDERKNSQLVVQKANLGVQRRYMWRANRRRVDVFEPKDDDVRWTKPQQTKKQKEEGALVYRQMSKGYINLDLVFMAN